jgi:GTP-binding protein
MVLYNRALGEKPQIVVLNKIDRTDTTEAAAAFEAALAEKSVHRISALEGTGIRRLLSDIVKVLDHAQKQ